MNEEKSDVFHSNTTAALHPASPGKNLVFGKYDLIRRLALGGMGEVFLARQTGSVSGTDRLVILKSLLPDLAEQDGYIDQFLDEARVAAKLNHPNVVQMFEAGGWNGLYFIAMEYIRGENLSRIAKGARAKGIAFPPQLVVRIIRDALLGLGHAHAAIDEMTGQPLGVVHRDVSPQNIMVRVDGVTKVVDFGIAMSGNRSSRTATGVLKGKLQYMAPEQINAEKVDARTDQFAMGIVLWELLTGRRCFAGDNEIQILRAVLQQPLVVPSSVVPGLPPEIDAIVMRMLDRDPAKRFETCQDAAEELTQWLNQGSRRVSETDVAAFIREIIGDSVDEATRNLASAGENFLISLTPSGGTRNADAAAERTPPTMMGSSKSRTGTEPVAREKRGMKGAFIGAAGAIIVFVGGGAFLMTGGGEATTPSPLNTLPKPQATGAADPSVPDAAPTPTPPPKKARARPPKIVGKSMDVEIIEPVGSKVIVDGKEWPSRVPTTLTNLALGPHKVEIVNDDGTRQDVPLALPPPTVVVLTNPPGAAVFVGGTSFGMTPTTIKKLSGGATHELALHKTGFETQRVIVEDLLDGETRELKIELDRVQRKPAKPAPKKEPVAALPPAGNGSLTLNTTPWTKVFVDGESYGTTPLVIRTLKAGKHQVRMENEAMGIKSTKTVTIVAGETAKLNLTLK